MVVREKDGLSAAECSESLSCRSTKSAMAPGAGVSDIGGEPLWKPPIASRALFVTASCMCNVVSIEDQTEGMRGGGTHEERAAVDLGARLEDGDAERTEAERVDGALRRERVLDVVDRHRDTQAILRSELGHVQRPAGRILEPAAHHVQVAGREADERERQTLVDEGGAEGGPLVRGEEGEAGRVADADVAARPPPAGVHALPELVEHVPDERLRAGLEVVVQVEVDVDALLEGEVEDELDVPLRVRDA